MDHAVVDARQELAGGKRQERGQTVPGQKAEWLAFAHVYLTWARLFGGDVARTET
uniref:hypothetical protein n=1 Tax=Streptomyces sp. CA-141956 TaxID=3240051 RepID=UPI003F4907D0